MLLVITDFLITIERTIHIFITVIITLNDRLYEK